jgi:hypothetical protein
MSTPDRLRAALADRYRVERELGAGGMAWVYLAEDLRHGRRVAIKVFRPDLMASIGAERFLREIRIIASLQHPNVVPLLDSGEADGILYYVMPYVEGASLRERLARSGELPVPEAVRLLTEVADALAAAHASGVVHRDIKPENVMLSGRHALVTDFGVAKALIDATGVGKVTTAGMALGTPSYMAPEQATADPQVDQRADIYALGVLAYEVLTGRPPFTGATAQQVLTAHVTQQPDPLARHRPGIPPALEQIVLRCMEKRPADRFQTAGDVLAQLESLATPGAGTTPVGATPVPAAPRRRRTLAMAMGGVAVLLALAAVYWGRRPEAAPVRAIVPDDIQLTFTGNADVPALSPDGKRMAYASSRCDSTGECLYDIRIQDVGGAQAATVLAGVTQIGRLTFTGDGRYLLFLGNYHGIFGAYSVSTLGGAPTDLGGFLGSLIGNGDTALVVSEQFGNPRAWLRRVRTSDGTAYDSIPFTKVPFGMVNAVVTGDRRWILLLDSTTAGGLFQRVLVLDRAGRVHDSLDVDRAAGAMGDVGIIAGSNRWWMLWPSGLTRDGRDVVMYSVDDDGRILRPDTVLRNAAIGSADGVTRGGAFLYSGGVRHFTVGAITATPERLLPIHIRVLAAATATDLSGVISPDGRTVLLGRYRVVDGKPSWQMSVLPFDSGPEQPLGPPEALANWSLGVGGLCTATLQGKSVQVLHSASLSDSPRLLATVPEAATRGLDALPGGGCLLLDRDGRHFQRIGEPGRPDTAFALPDTSARAIDVEPSPDGSTIGIERLGESLGRLHIARFSLVTGAFTELAVLSGTPAGNLIWLVDGRILVPIGESASSAVLYSVPADGGPPARIGVLPRNLDSFTLSADGTRGVSVAGRSDFDLHLIRNFGELGQ